MNTILVALKHLRDRLMLVRPDNQVKELGNHAFRDRVSPTHSQVHSFILVLVQHQDVEPIIFVLEWSFELDLLVLESHVQSLIFHVSDTIESNLC